MEGHYRNGKSIRKNYYYSNNGVLERREIYRFKKIKTKFYYPNGNVKLMGSARIDNNEKEIHYYFYGKWKRYNENGKLEKKLIYEKGKLIRSNYTDKSISINDSLVIAIDEIDKEFSSHNKSLTDSLKLTDENSVKEIIFMERLKNLDSISFSKIENIINKFGYPSKKTIGELSPVPFYILSFAPIYIKEKYLLIFSLAATNGDIDLKSYAFYIDKIKIAKGQKQIYGTQYYLDSKKKIYYPSEDIENLNNRRLQMGFDN